MSKTLSIAVGLLLIIGAVAWRFVVSPQMEVRFPDGWSWEINSIGQTSFADENGVFPDGTTVRDDPINITVRTVTADTDGAPAGQVLISDHYETRNATTNAIEWEFTTTATVDQKTGQYPDSQDYYFFPSNVERDKTYRVSNSSYQSIEMTFQREEAIGGINTYLFGHYEPLVNTNAYPDHPLEDGQIIVCEDFALEYWVEPQTGEIVKYGEWCEGDWVINEASREKVYGLSRWGGENSGDDLIRRAAVVNARLNQHALQTVYIPLALGALGLAALAFGLLSGRKAAA